jgi:D-3-phosphoglycerate dehydrogenase
MAKARILIADPIHEDAIAKLKAAGFDVVVRSDISAADLLKAVSEFDALVVRGRTKVTREAITAGRKLRVIARSGVGLDNVDLPAAEERKIQVINSPEGPSVSVAELVFGLALSILRKIALGDEGMRQGKWLKKESMGVELHGRSLGIVGFGLIGEEVAKRAAAFGMKSLGFDVLPDRVKAMKSLGVEYKTLPDLIAAADILTVHVPLNPKTKGLIGAAEIARMRQGAVVINTARGGIVDEKALYDGLTSGRLGGAGLDVFTEEPPHTNPLLSKLVTLPNVVSTPHIGAQTEEAEARNSAIIAEKLLKLLR